MTVPVTTEALVEALARHYREYHAYLLSTAEEMAQALVAGPLAPFLAAIQRVTAERDEARALYNDAAEARDNAGYLGSVAQCVSDLDAELVRLRAEVEALKAERVALRTDASTLGARLGNASQYDDRRVLRDLCWEAGNFLARRIVRPVLPALARAATAREGQADE